MAWDLCLVFCEKPLPVDVLIEQAVLQESPATDLYLCTGAGCPQSGGKSFFGFWSDEWFDLAALSCDLSRDRGRVCLAWKAEHRGRGGYQIYSDGARIKELRSDQPEYVLLPAEGVEKAFRRILMFNEDDDRVLFPEILLDNADVRCLKMVKDNGALKFVEAPETPREKMFHYGLEVEPVLPLNPDDV